MSDAVGPESRIEFGSSAYIQAVEQALMDELEETNDVAFSMSETLSDPPAHLAPPSGRLGWSFSIEDGQLEFAGQPSDGAAYRVVVDYAAAVELTRMRYRADMDAVARCKQRLTDEGRFVAEGDRPSEAVDFMAGVHDRLVPLTFAGPTTETGR